MLKVTVIGGGSTYTPELVNGFLARMAQFPLDELWLMDIDPQRLEVVGGFAQRMVEAKGAPFKVVLTTNQREAVKDASYVTTQLRVGKMEARRRDEYLGLRHGLIGQETTGVGGMAKALRTIPVILNIANDMRELSAEVRCWSTSPIRPGWSHRRCANMPPMFRRWVCAMRRSPSRCISSKGWRRRPARRSIRSRRVEYAGSQSSVLASRLHAGWRRCLAAGHPGLS